MTCWDFKKCPPETYTACPAYPDNGEECWNIPGTLCEDGKLRYLDVREKIEHCLVCDYYRSHGKSKFNFTFD